MSVVSFAIVTENRKVGSNVKIKSKEKIMVASTKVRSF